LNTRIVLIGVLVLVVGVALIGVGAAAAFRSSAIITTFSELHAGEYVSTELVLNTTSGVVVSSPAAAGGIVPAQDLNLVNSTNLSRYAIPYNSSVAGAQTYRQLQGDFYYVAFSSSPPTTKIIATNPHSGVIGFGALILAGFACIIAGIVVSVIGLRRKNTKKNELTMDEQYELSRQKNT
jgi:hypothetical protein